MNSRVLFIFAFFVIVSGFGVVIAQEVRPRVIINQSQQQQQIKTQPQQPKSEPVAVPSPPNASTQQTLPRQASTTTTSTNKTLPSFIQHRARINEALKLFTTRPVQTSYSVTTTPSIEFVTIAALDPATSKIHQVTLPKKMFLTRNIEVQMTTDKNTLVKIRVVRANGVNTAVTIFDEDGKSFTPLLVQYPIEKNGKYNETAYYISVHPALRTPDAVSAGKVYLRTTIDLAIKRLKEKGVTISPDIIAIAERLCVIEHADHIRYRTENRADLFDEIYMLLAFNEGNTYRYAVSFAGAGGLVQMIPATYRMVRTMHPKVGLMEDFVSGMRNHVNAVQAQLLYMQDTWNDLAANEDVAFALENGTATQTELMAAGYNSNPARLPAYLRRGGANWRTLIPRETQMYLDIYKSHQSLVSLSRSGVQKPQNANR